MNPQPNPAVTPDRRRSPAWKAWARFRRQRAAVLSGGWLAVWLLVLVAWPVLRHPGLAGVVPTALAWSPTGLSDAQFQPPCWRHWLGTDVHGRDLLSRTIHGARISLLVGGVGAAVSLLIGVAWGATAGYLGGRWDNRLMRVVDVLYTLPSIVLVLVLIAVLEQTFRTWLARWVSPEAAPAARLVLLFAGLGAVSWLTMARVVRGQVLSLRQRGFVEASRALGAGHLRILARHILPNVYGVVLVYLTLTIPSIILYESFLSYLGLGIQPPQASLGYLIADGAANLNPLRIYWWLIVFPGGLLAVTLLALNLLGDGLRDAWDPGRHISHLQSEPAELQT